MFVAGRGRGLELDMDRLLRNTSVPLYRMLRMAFRLWPGDATSRYKASGVEVCMLCASNVSRTVPGTSCRSGWRLCSRGTTRQS